MKTPNLEAVNDKFAIAGQLVFKAGQGGLPVAEINSRHASATVALHGGHVLTFQPHGQKPVLWVSRLSQYQQGTSVRGGIPVCWPWFAAHPSDPNKPFHGFARILMWKVTAGDVLSDGSVRLKLGLADDEATREIWDNSFRLELEVTVGPALQVELVVHNPSDQAFNYTGALHSYFSVSDVTQIRILGLEDTAYLDKVDAFKQKVQAGPVTIEDEIDRIYLNTTADCIIDDPGWQRQIRIGKDGSGATVVWNPWQEKAKGLPDFGDEEYMGMVCVETANAASDVVMVMPGSEHRLKAAISI